MLDMPAYANRLGAMIMALNEGVPDRASTPADSWGRYCCGHCGRAVSPEREEYRVCGACGRHVGKKLARFYQNGPKQIGLEVYVGKIFDDEETGWAMAGWVDSRYGRFEVSANRQEDTSVSAYYERIPEAKAHLMRICGVRVVIADADSSEVARCTCGAELDPEAIPTAYGSYCDPDQGGCGHCGEPVDRRERED